jgi:hypothetical protein
MGVLLQLCLYLGTGFAAASVPRELEENEASRLIKGVLLDIVGHEKSVTVQEVGLWG